MNVTVILNAPRRAPARLACFVVVLLSCATAEVFAQIGVCGWQATNDLPELKGANEIVEWVSTADSAGTDSWNVATYVVNLDRKGARNIDWGAAGMRVEGLRPQHFAHLCTASVQGRNDRQGPLYFARDLSAMQTTVYAGRGNADREKQLVAGAPLRLESQFILTDSSARPAKDAKGAVRVKVSTELVKTEKAYLINYTVENLSDVDVVVDLPIDPGTAKEMGDGRIPLEKKGIRKASVTTDRFPAAVRFPVRITEASSQGTSAIVDVPTFRSPAPRPPR